MVSNNFYSQGNYFCQEFTVFVLDNGCAPENAVYRAFRDKNNESSRKSQAKKKQQTANMEIENTRLQKENLRLRNELAGARILIRQLTHRL
jgi:hypothetical protein